MNNTSIYIETLNTDIENKKSQLLDLLKNWYHFQTEVKQRIMFSYDLLFGDIEEEIDDKHHKARILERKYQLIAYKLQRGEKITRPSLDIIDRLLDRDKNRNIEISTKRTTNKIYQSRFHPQSQQNQQLDTKERDQYDFTLLYRQIVKRLHPDIVGESNSYRNFWDNVQHCYRLKDIERMKMFYLILCKEQRNNIEDVKAEAKELAEAASELQKCIDKQKKDLADLRIQEPFCFDGKLENQSWIIERKNQLRDRLIQINKRIIYNNKLINSVKIAE